jgi:multidrug efflux pump subunit AcrA (membrane-fusion protein)
MSKPKSRPWHLYMLAVAAVAIAVLAVAQIGAPSSSARTSTQIVTAQNGIVQSTVSGTGNVQAGSDLSVNFQTSGTLSAVDVKVGQHVVKGQLLATLDSTSAQLSLAQAEQNLTAAQAQLSTAQATSSSTTTSTATTASLNIGSGSGTTEFVSAVSTLPATTTTKPATSTTATKTTSQTTTTSTPQTTTTTKQPTTAPAAPAAPSAAPSASGGSAGTGSGGSSSSTTSPAATIASAQAAVYSAEATVNNAKTALAATKLYAPISGTIVSLANLAPGNAVAAGSTSAAAPATSTSGLSSTSSTGNTAGTTAGSLGNSGSSSSTASSSTSGGSTSPFAEIVNTHTMTMTVALSESDVSKVKVGQPATVTPNALTGVEFGAHVSAISTVGTTSSGVVSYSATLTLDQTSSQVKPGMSASASIIVAQEQGVNVPNAAVTGTGSIATVTLDKSGKKTQKQVAVGLRGNTRTQIASGLSAGDQLAVTTTLPPLTSGTSTTSNSGSGTLGGTTVRPGGFGGGGGGGGAGGARGATGGSATGTGAGG